jgi:catechol 2,3-dioxygenase-like lactoylglutathione lyase family enzyme
MALKMLAHVCINTKDLEASRKFYCEGLGLKKRFDFTKNGKVVGFYLKAGKGSYIEFFLDTKDYPGQSPLRHFCLETDDIEKARKRLLDNGIEATEIKLGCDATWQFWFKDPNGIDVEFHQYTRKSAQKTRKSVEIDW